MRRYMQSAVIFTLRDSSMVSKFEVSASTMTVKVNMGIGLNIRHWCCRDFYIFLACSPQLYSSGVPGYRSRGPGSIPGTIRFSEKSWFWNGVHSASWVQLRSYLKEKVAVGIRRADHVAPLYPQKLVLTSATSCGRSVGIFRSRTQATEFFFVLFSLSGL
jgi:hypothetical protein